MAPKKNKSKFVPFIHKNLEIKNELIELARKLREGDFKLENALASVVIYSNIAEYLAEHLLENLNYLVKESSYKYFSGFVYIASTYSTERNMTLGTYIHELRKFSFPDKENILAILEISVKLEIESFTTLQGVILRKSKNLLIMIFQVFKMNVKSFSKR